MSFKSYLKTNKLTRLPYAKLKSIKVALEHRHNLHYNGTFKDRSRGSKYLCIVLAGYKEYLYKDVFKRIEEYKKSDMDICIISSGLFSPLLDDLAERNNWSYLSTKQNNVSLVQNIAINLHPKAEYIFKLDEDFFICRDFFDNLLKAYNFAENNGYAPGVLAPLIPINGYGHFRILKKLHLEDEYEKRFGKLIMASGPERPIENSPEVARFFWGEGGIIPSVDVMNEVFSKENTIITAVPIRFSIGAILFKRDLWEDMGYFKVGHRNRVELGNDEVYLCSYCLLKSRPVLVSENVVAGHFSFGSQTKDMKAYYTDNPDKF